MCMIHTFNLTAQRGANVIRYTLRFAGGLGAAMPKNADRKHRPAKRVTKRETLPLLES